MRVTEEEARKKWCPMVAAADVPADANGDLRPRCIASECMAWRVVPGKKSNFGVETGEKMVGWARGEQHPSYGYWYTFPETGYCGLAGKP